MSPAPPRRCQARCPCAPGGFTLIEVLVAISVMAVLALMGWRVVDSMLRTNESVDAYSGSVMALQAGLGQWRADLDAMAEINHIVPLHWDGRVLRISRRSALVPDPGIIVVAWTVRGTTGQAQWLRWQSPLVQTREDWQAAWDQAAQWAQHSASAQHTQNAVRIAPVQDWQIYYFRDDAWVNPLSGSNASFAPLPLGVRLVITPLPEGQALSGKITLDWSRPGGRNAA